jgi:hypothetical protein
MGKNMSDGFYEDELDSGEDYECDGNASIAKWILFGIACVGALLIVIGVT